MAEVPDRDTKEEIREAVRNGYGKIAKAGGTCCGPSCCGSGTTDQVAGVVGHNEDEIKTFVESLTGGLLGATHGAKPKQAGESADMQSSIRTVGTVWTWADWLGAAAVRCDIGRMRYAVEPGLYAVNAPGPDAPVFVSANYKLSFDHLRHALHGLSGWILVLDTKGINVWCAAGKGTFGTAELVQRVGAANLAQHVSHRTLVVPQLGAPGVAAHEAHRQTGFRVVYGPVRAKDIPTFLRNGMKADAEMRNVRFRLADRLAVVPVELVSSVKYALPLAVAFAVVAGWRSGGWNWSTFGTQGGNAAALVLGGYLFVGTAVPSLLPWLPGRAFSVKGASAGVLAWLLLWAAGPYARPIDLAAWLILFCAVASFMGLNFTGASTYTSLSGVKKETRVAVPVIIVGLLVSLGLWIRACGIF